MKQRRFSVSTLLLVAVTTAAAACLGQSIEPFSHEMAAQFVFILKNLGFKYVTLDCEGYRSGSMNAVLPIESIKMAE